MQGKSPTLWTISLASGLHHFPELRLWWCLEPQPFCLLPLCHETLPLLPVLGSGWCFIELRDANSFSNSWFLNAQKRKMEPGEVSVLRCCWISNVFPMFTSLQGASVPPPGPPALTVPWLFHSFMGGRWHPLCFAFAFLNLHFPNHNEGLVSCAHYLSPLETIGDLFPLFIWAMCVFWLLSCRWCLLDINLLSEVW